MTETVAVALITAITGLVGALLGSVAALFGPSLVSSSTRRAERREMRRARIVEYVKSGVALVNAEASMATSEGSQAEVYAAMEKLNADTIDLTSHLRRRDRRVKDWMRQAENEMDAQKGAQEQRDYWSAISSSMQDWHVGVPARTVLVPFQILRDGQKVEMKRLKKWSDYSGA
ncbi:hypothetical protein K2F54_15385 [Cryobacterium sp. 1639]|uniref:hypothetical protein n=1 Tax=Cryobacterium inferilacus TaxID=2866629 RepID=UPI001C73D7A5|nr:hypothetical protein [Cryobacterium sp. 1639]MBX0301356.1 hypothetical protein [Cryobacterium sp. 1639]